MRTLDRHYYKVSSLIVIIAIIVIIYPDNKLLTIRNSQYISPILIVRVK